MGYYSNKKGYLSYLPLSAKIYIATIVGVITLSLTKCGAQLTSNRDNIDTEKSFNFIIDYNGEGTSIVKVDSYSDYRGETVEFTTQDGLQVLSGLHHCEIMYATSYEVAYQRALQLTGGNPDKIYSYDLSQGLDVDVDDSKTWNKNFFNLNYNFDYAITETDNGIIITNISTWRDWNEDDKVQFVDADGNIYLTTYMTTKLVNSEYAPEDAIYEYALSLAGSEDRISGDIDKETKKVKKLVKEYEPVQNTIEEEE